MIIPNSKLRLENYKQAEIISLPGQKNSSGQLNFWENLNLFPDGIRRCFWITDVKLGELRGSHAHYLEAQVLVALTGEIQIRVEGIDQSELNFTLNRPDQGLYVPALNWVEVSFGPEAVLLGLSDREFSEEDYIRDKKQFGSLQKSRN